MGSRRRTSKCWSILKVPVLTRCLTSKTSWRLSKISFNLVNPTSTTSWFVSITDHTRVLQDLTNTLSDSGHSYQKSEDLQQCEPEEDELAECMSYIMLIWPLHLCQHRHRSLWRIARGWNVHGWSGEIDIWLRMGSAHVSRTDRQDWKSILQDLHEMLVKPIKKLKGCQLIALFDSCHSGTMLSESLCSSHCK